MASLRDRASSPTDMPPTKAAQKGCLVRAHGLLLVGGGLAIGGLGWLVLGILSDNLRRSPEHAEQVSSFALWMIEHRTFLPLATLPVAGIGAWMLVRGGGHAGSSGSTAHRRALPWFVLALATLWLVVVFAAVLVAFVQFLAPLYQYHELG